MHTIDLVLRILMDSKDHEVEELVGKTKVRSERIETVLRFLEKYGFIEYDERTQIVRIREDTKTWLRSIEDASLKPS